MALWRVYYHFVWATKQRRPLITAELEKDLYGYIVGKAVALGAIVHAIDGTETHTHLVGSVRPTLAISDFMKGLKGSGAHYVNHGLIPYHTKFSWQGGYGVFSFSAKQLDDIVAYVRNQKDHHRLGTTIDALEQEDDDDNRPRLWKEGVALQELRIPAFEHDPDDASTE